MRLRSITVKFLILVTAALVVTGMVALFFGDRQFRGIIDRSQEELYYLRIHTILSGLERTYGRIEATLSPELYENQLKRRFVEDFEYDYYPSPRDYPFILDSNGVFVAAPAPSSTRTVLRANPPVIQALLAQRNGTYETPFEGRTYWLIFQTFDRWDWLVGYVVPHEVKYKDLHRFRAMFCMSMAGAMVLALAVIWVIVTHFAGPIARLTIAARAIEAGRLDDPIDTSGVDELGTLARGFVAMRDAIRQDMAALVRTNEHLRQEIEDRQRIEAALAQSEDKLRLILMASPHAITMADLQGNLVQCNSAAERLHGFGPGELIGKNALEFVAPEDHGRVLEGMKYTAEHGVIRNVELTFLHRNGRRFPAELSANVVRDAQGRPVAFVTIAEDVTERRRTIETLRRSEALLQQAQTLANIGHFYHEVETETLQWSGQLYRIYGLDPHEPAPRGDRHAQWVVAEDWPRLREILEPTRPTGDSFEIEYRIRRSDGQIRVLNCIAFWNKDERNRVTGLLGTVQDVTDHRQGEQQLRDYQQRLRSLASELSLAEERQRRRIASLLHDGACQDLALLKMQLQSLCSEMPLAQRAPFEPLCEGLTSTIEGLRSLTMDLSPPTLYLAGLEAALESLLEQEIQGRRGIRYTLEADKAALPEAQDLRILIFQSVRELLINVVKHAKANHVRVTLKRKGAEIHVTVADNGRGFDVRAVESSMSRSGGFGLFNIRERLDLLGGHFRIQSKQGWGSRFILIVPAADSSCI